MNYFKVQRLNNELWKHVTECKEIRKKETTQKDVALTIGYPLTKIKQVENGTCKDIDCILCYISLIKPNNKIII